MRPANRKNADAGKAAVYSVPRRSREAKRGKPGLIDRMGFNRFSIAITLLLFMALFAFGSFRYERFFSSATFLNLFNDNAYLIVVACGETMVLLTGGIDISVASTLAFSCVFPAWLLQRGVPTALVLLIALVIGFAFGLFQGVLVHYFNIQPFIVTLAGMFFMRGLCAVVSTASIAISDPFYTMMAMQGIRIGKARIYFYVLIALAAVLISALVLRRTRFGRGLYAIGGSEQSALLMGLPVARIKVLVYGICGFTAALGGIIFSFYTLAGYALQNMGLELDAISSAVIGGTLLSGGVGTVAGSLIGVLIQGLIQTIVTYQNLNAWWTKVTIGALLCLFIVIQRLLSLRAEKQKGRLS